MFPLADVAGDATYGIVGMLLALAVAIVVIIWILFPFIVNAKFNELIREVRALRTDVNTQRSGESRGIQAPPTLKKEPPPMSAKEGKPHTSAVVYTERDVERVLKSPDVYKID